MLLRGLTPTCGLRDAALMQGVASMVLWSMLWALLPGSNDLPPAVTSLLEDAEYTQARRAVERELRAGKVTKDQRVQLYQAHAVCDLSLGDDASAQESFQKLLVLEPAWRPDPDRTSPKVLDAFQLVRSRMAEQGALDQAFGLQFQPLDDVASGVAVPVTVAFDAEPAAAIARAFVRYRQVGESGFESVELVRTPGDRVAFSGEIPTGALASAEDEVAVDYLLEAQAADGARLAGAGSADLPLRFRVRRPEALARLDRPDARRGAQMEQVMKVLALVMPVVVGAASISVVGMFAAGVVALTALEPGASHFFLRPRPQDGQR